MDGPCIIIIPFTNRNVHLSVGGHLPVLFYFDHVTVCEILASRPWIEPTRPALEGRVLVTGLPGKPHLYLRPPVQRMSQTQGLAPPSLPSPPCPILVHFSTPTLLPGFNPLNSEGLEEVRLGLLSTQAMRKAPVPVWALSDSQQHHSSHGRTEGQTSWS